VRLKSGLAFIHVHSMRLAQGQEALVARALTRHGTSGYGFSFRLDATEARQMAMFNAGLNAERPRIAPALDHPWERAWLDGRPIPWDCEPGFSALAWLSQ
jgi:hypothetical protein